MENPGQWRRASAAGSFTRESPASKRVTGYLLMALGGLSLVVLALGAAGVQIGPLRHYDSEGWPVICVALSLIFGTWGLVRAGRRWRVTFGPTAIVHTRLWFGSEGATETYRVDQVRDVLVVARPRQFDVLVTIDIEKKWRSLLAVQTTLPQHAEASAATLAGWYGKPARQRDERRGPAADSDDPFVPYVPYLYGYGAFAGSAEDPRTQIEGLTEIPEFDRRDLAAIHDGPSESGSSWGDGGSGDGDWGGDSGGDSGGGDGGGGGGD